MKLVRDNKSGIGIPSVGRDALDGSGDGGPGYSAEVDLRHKVVVGHDGEIDVIGSLAYHLCVRNGPVSANNPVQTAIEIDAILDAELDFTRSEVLEVVMRITGIRSINVRDTHWVNSNDIESIEQATKTAEELADSLSKADLHFGIHSLIAYATHAAQTCDSQWPVGIPEALNNSFLVNCSAELDDDVLLRIAADAGTMWEFISPSSLYALSTAIGDCATEFVDYFDESTPSLLCNTMVSVYAPNAETIISCFNRFGKSVSKIITERKHASLDEVLGVIVGVRDHLLEIRPSVADISRIWTPLGVLMNCIVGFLVGIGMESCGISYGKIVSVDSEMYDLGHRAGSAHLLRKYSSGHEEMRTFVRVTKCAYESIYAEMDQ